MPDVLPPEILAKFAVHTGAVQEISQPPQGRNSSVWRLQTASGEFIVKCYTNWVSTAALEREAEVLQALAAFVPAVPRFVARAGDYLLFTYLEGVNLATLFEQTGDVGTRTQLAEEYGRLLQIIHQWTPQMPCPAYWFADTLAFAESNADDAGWETPVSSPGVWHGFSHRTVWEEIQQAKDNITPRIVLCHGDWCLPNVLVVVDKATAAVDWLYCDWMDYRMDLAMGLWSLRYNSTTLLGDTNTDRYLDAFLRGYGYDEPVATLRFWEALSLLR